METAVIYEAVSDDLGEPVGSRASARAETLIAIYERHVLRERETSNGRAVSTKREKIGLLLKDYMARENESRDESKNEHERERERENASWKNFPIFSTQRRPHCKFSLFRIIIFIAPTTSKCVRLLSCKNIATLLSLGLSRISCILVV